MKKTVPFLSLLIVLSINIFAVNTNQIINKKPNDNLLNKTLICSQEASNNDRQKTLNKKLNILNQFSDSKSKNQNVQKLDSFVFYQANPIWDNDSVKYTNFQLNVWRKTLYSYSSTGVQTTTNYSHSESLEKLMPVTKQDSTFDSFGNCIQFISYEWKDSWRPIEKTDSIFDENGRFIKFFNYEWERKDDSLQWIGDWGEEFFYGTNGNIIQKIRYEFDEDDSEWITSGQWDYEYDNNGRLKLISYYYYEVFWYKEEYTYDSNGNEIKFLYAHWDKQLLKWDFRRMEDHTYDENNNVTKYIVYGWDKEQEEWKTESELRYNYYEDGKLFQILDYTKDHDYFSNKHEFTYDDYLICDTYYVFVIDTTYAIFKTCYDINGNLINHYNYNYGIDNIVNVLENFYNENNQIIHSDYYNYWNSSNGTWDEEVKNDYTYNAEGNLLEHIVNSKFNGTSNQWETTSKGVYYYSEHSLTTPDIKESKGISIYPNPVIEKFKITFDSDYRSAHIDIFNVQGEKIITKTIRNGEFLSLQELSDGIYFYKITIDEYIKTGKLVKK